MTVGFDAHDDVVAEWRRTTYSDPDVTELRSRRLCSSLDSPVCFDLRADAREWEESRESLGKRPPVHALTAAPGEDEAPEPIPPAEPQQKQKARRKAKKAKMADPVKGFLGHYEKPGAFAFRVGDVVVHRGHGQVGVVQERFDEMGLSDDWFNANAAPGMRKRQPFYSILVGGMGGKFTRHGAQSSHRLWDDAQDRSSPKVDHPEVSKYFGELVIDGSHARYHPKDFRDANQIVDVVEWDKREL